MTNQIPNSKAIALTRKNNQKYTQIQIAIQDYIHIFTSFKITFLKKFKQNILDNPIFTL